jgi:hypothetical protein
MSFLRQAQDRPERPQGTKDLLIAFANKRYMEILRRYSRFASYAPQNDMPNEFPSSRCYPAPLLPCSLATCSLATLPMPFRLRDQFAHLEDGNHRQQAHE